MSRAKEAANWHIDITPKFKAGDPEPTSYLDWHEWARVQAAAGLKQRQCKKCNKWRYPQDLKNGVCREEN